MRWSILGLIFLLFMIGACDGPTTFERDNPLDRANDDFKPEPPEGLSVEVRGDSVHLRWNDKSDAEDGYLIERAVDDTSSFVEVAHLEPDITAFAEPINYQGFFAYYRVSAFRVKDGETLRLDGVQQLIPLYEFERMWPRITVETERLLRIEWKDLFDFETGFAIERGTEGSFEQIAVVSENSTQYLDRYEFEGDVRYSYRIRALYDSVQSPPSPERDAKIRVSPPRISDITHQSPTAVNVQWIKTPLAVEYIVEREINYNGEYTTLVRVASDVTSISDQSVDTTKEYRYRVRTLTSDPSTEYAIHYGEAFSQLDELPWLDRPLDIVMTEDGRTLAIGTTRGGAAWRYPSKELCATYRFREGISALDASPDGVTFALGVNDGLLIFDDCLGNDEQIFTSGAITALDYGPDGSMIVTAEGENGQYVRLRSTETGDVIQAFNIASVEQTTSVAHSPDGRYVSACSNDAVRVFEVPNGEIVRSIPHEGGMCVARFVEGGTSVAILSGATLRIIDITTGNEKARTDFNSSPKDLKVAPDGVRVIVSFENGTLRIWDVKVGQVMASTILDTTFPLIDVVSDTTLVTTGKRGDTFLWRYGPHWAQLDLGL